MTAFIIALLIFAVWGALTYFLSIYALKIFKTSSEDEQMQIILACCAVSAILIIVFFVIFGIATLALA